MQPSFITAKIFLGIASLAMLVTGGALRTADAQLPPRWNNSQLLGAGEPILPMLGEPLYENLAFAFHRPVHLLSYTVNGEHYYALLEKESKLLSFPADKPKRLEYAINLRSAFARNGGMQAQCLGMTFAPGFPKQPQIYIAWNTHQRFASENVISRFTIASTTPLKLDPDSRLDIIRWKTNGHNGCDLHFGPEDGYLYASTGDGQAAGDPANTGQETNDLRGSVLRLDVSQSTPEQPYQIPPDNPFVGIEEVRPELWCYGLRNPWRMAFHPTTNELWIADNGDTNWEMIHVTKKGANHGWSAMEGNHPFRAGNVLKGPTLEHTPPIIEHYHDVMRSIIGGLFYRGAAMPELHDHYIYGCYFTKRVWAVSYRDGEVGDPFPIANLNRGIVSFVEDAAQEIVVNCHDGPPVRLVPNPHADAKPIPLPTTLSGTGLFADTARQQLADGVTRYAIIAESWNDGATKQRAFALPPKKPDEGFQVLGGTEVRNGYRPPFGSTFLQTLSLGQRPVETQILFFDGVWRGYSYRWREDGSDADLVPEEGANATVDGQAWRFSSRNECLTCHTQKTGFLVSFGTRQLNREHPDGLGNQLELMKQWQMFRRARHGPTGGRTPRSWDRIVDPHDETADLEQRARVYLDINCSHCHREAAAGGRANFQLMSWLGLDETGLIGAAPIIGMTGDPEACIVKSGDPDRSELLHRMKLETPGVRMPLISSSKLDERGVALIDAWIRSLPAQQPGRP